MLGAGLRRWSTSCNVSWLWVGHTITIKKKRSRKANRIEELLCNGCAVERWKSREKIWSDAYCPVCLADFKRWPQEPFPQRKSSFLKPAPCCYPRPVAAQ